MPSLEFVAMETSTKKTTFASRASLGKFTTHKIYANNGEKTYVYATGKRKNKTEQTKD